MQSSQQKLISLSTDTSGMATEPDNSRVYNIQKSLLPSGMNCNFQDNYGAFRLISNMGVSSGSPKISTIRQGFYGETYKMASPNTDRVSIDRPPILEIQGPRVSVFQQNGIAMASSPKWTITDSPKNSIPSFEMQAPRASVFQQNGIALASSPKWAMVDSPQNVYNNNFSSYSQQNYPIDSGHKRYRSNGSINVPNGSFSSALPPIYGSHGPKNSFSGATSPVVSPVNSIILQKSSFAQQEASMWGQNNQLRAQRSNVPFNQVESNQMNILQTLNMRGPAQRPKMPFKNEAVYPNPQTYVSRSLGPQASYQNLPRDVNMKNPNEMTIPVKNQAIENNKNYQHQNEAIPNMDSMMTSPHEEPQERSSIMQNYEETDFKVSVKKKNNRTKKSDYSRFKVINVKKNLKTILWTMVYCSLFGKDVEKKVQATKKAANQNSSKQIQEYKNQTLEFIKKYCLPSLKKLYKQSKSLVLVNENKENDEPVPLKDVQKRFNIIAPLLVDILEALNNGITKENYPKPVVDLFVSISSDHAAVPHRLLTLFECSCLEFTYYGTLKNMSPIRIRMLIGIFTLVKGLIFVFLNQPWTYLSGVKESVSLAKYIVSLSLNDLNNSNLKSCSSILYCIAMDFFREGLQINKNNQQFIHPDNRVKTLKSPLAAFSFNDDGLKPSQDTLEKEVIMGLYHKSSITDCFSLHPELVSKIKRLVEECSEKLYSLVKEAQTKSQENLD